MLLFNHFPKTKMTAFFTALLTCCGLAVLAQQDHEQKIVVTEKGTTYEVVGWEVKSEYNPDIYTFFTWEEPIIAKRATTKSKLVPVSEFDRPPVFDGICLTAEKMFDCSNKELKEYVAEHSFDYPDAAQAQKQEGTTYVTFTLDEEGNFAGNMKVTTENKPCKGCEDAAADLVASTEDKWFAALIDGEPVKTQLTIPVRFNLIEK